MRTVIAKRPAESLAALGIAPLAFDFLTERGVADPVAAITALVVGCMPAVVSSVLDRRADREGEPEVGVDPDS